MKTVLNIEKRAFHVYVVNAYTELVQLRKDGEVMSFNDLLLKLMPEVKNYVQNRLNVAVSKGMLDKNRFKSDDIIDQLFIEVYDNFEEVKKGEFLYLWLFKKADELLDDILTEEEFDSYFFENIDKYSKPEWDAMEEKYSTDGDGDYQMLEEFDSQEYSKNDYVLNHVFIEDKDQELIKALDEKLDDQNLKKHETMVLFNMPETMRSVYELYNRFNFNIAEIAIICDLSENQIANFLKNATEKMRTSFVSRYLNDN